MSLFKRAAARGVAYELVRRGVADFATKEAMDEAADAVSDHMMGGMGDLSGDAGHDPEELAAVAEQLMAIADQLKAEGHAPKMASENLKLAAQQSDLGAVAFEQATSVMNKAAAETALVGPGSSAQNTEGNAAGHNDVAKLDLKNRSEGEYAVAKGDTKLDTSAGEVGQVKQPTKTPDTGVSGTNSVNEDSKKASLEAVRKVATALIMGPTSGNKEPQSAPYHDVTRLDLHNRPIGYAVVPKGGANFSEPQVARVGLERRPDVMPSRTVSGTNSVIEASKAAAEQEIYVEMFRKTASDVGPYLPVTLSEEQKIAAIQSMMPMDREHRGVFLQTLKQAEEGGISAMLDKMKHESGESKAEEKKEEKKDEKEEGKKESALLDQIRAMARSASSYR